MVASFFSPTVVEVDSFVASDDDHSDNSSDPAAVDALLSDEEPFDPDWLPRVFTT